MPIVKALRSFEHYGSVKRGQRINVSEQAAKDLIAKKLVERTGAESSAQGGAASPLTNAGEAQQSSASPAAQASRKTTAKASGIGGKSQKSQAATITEAPAGSSPLDSSNLGAGMNPLDSSNLTNDLNPLNSSNLSDEASTQTGSEQGSETGAALPSGSAE